MREFLHGWRRKVGGVALMILLNVCGLWLRSTVISDFVRTPYHLFCSSDGWFAWSRMTPNPYWNWAWETRSSHSNGDEGGDDSLLWEEWTINSTEINLPYWLPAIPLTLLSAYLILWKPRKRVNHA